MGRVPNSGLLSGAGCSFPGEAITETPSLDLLTIGPGFSGLSLFLLNLRIRSMKKIIIIRDIPPHTHHGNKQPVGILVVEPTYRILLKREDGTGTEKN